MRLYHEIGDAAWGDRIGTGPRAGRLPGMRVSQMATNAAQRDDEIALEIDLFGEAKSTALWLAEKYGVSAGDVVARALGLIWLVHAETEAGNRIVVEDRFGERRPITINLRVGDAGASGDPG